MISIRRALFLVCLLLVTGPLVAFWAWPHSRTLEHEVAEARVYQLLVARTMARTLERYHGDLLGGFNSSALALANADVTAGNQSLLSGLNVQHIVLIDRMTGESVSGIEGTKPLPTRVISAGLLAGLRASAIQGMAKTLSVSIEDDGTPVFHIVRQFGQRLAVATVETTYLADLGTSIKFGSNGHAVVLDRAGRVLAHPNQEAVKRAQDLSGIGLVRRALAGEAGSGTFFSPVFKAEMVAGFAPVNGAGWAIMVPQPISELLAAADAARRDLFLMFTTGLLIAALIAIRAGIIITAPLSRLNASAKLMAAGNLDVRVDNDSRLTPHELALLTTSFNDMAAKLAELSRRGAELRERAEKANESKSEFVRTVTHELRSPVNAIIGFSELLAGRSAGKITPETRDSYLRDINAGARHLLSLVNDLLDLAKMESGQYELVEEEFWIDEITRRASRYVETLARERNVEVRVTIDGETPVVFGDERALFQALLNLVSNAVRYGRRGGLVRIAASVLTDCRIELVVADDGPGIAADDLVRVMLPFQRIQSSDNAGMHGSGLGLPIVKQFIELHGGTFELTSTLGVGTRARILLPAERTRQRPEVDTAHNLIADVAKAA
jgi:signal transduction histidine kinase